MPAGLKVPAALEGSAPPPISTGESKRFGVLGDTGVGELEQTPIT